MSWVHVHISSFFVSNIDPCLPVSYSDVWIEIERKLWHLLCIVNIAWNQFPWIWRHTDGSKDYVLNPTHAEMQNQPHPLHTKMLQCSKWLSRFSWPWKDLRAAVLQVVGGARVWVLKCDGVLSVNVQDVANHRSCVIVLDHCRHCNLFWIPNILTHPR